MGIYSNLILCGIALFFGASSFTLVSSEKDIRKSPLHIAAFNVRAFGKKYMTDKGKVDFLVKILRRYDIVLIQEVRDKSGTALENLKTKLNNGTVTESETWSYIASERIGRSSYKEQYVFFYRNRKDVKLIKSYQVKDETEDLYEREPFTVNFQYRPVENLAPKNVVLLGFHSKPAKTINELFSLAATVKNVSRDAFPDVNTVVAMGDMNADCSYLRGKWRRKLDLFNSEEFHSLIPHTSDTAVSRKDCAYDRIIAYGDTAALARDASVFDFQRSYNLTNSRAMKISDHFPVEFYLD